MDWSGLLTGLGFFLVIEGLVYTLGANALPGTLKMLIEAGPQAIRATGIGALLLGVLVIWLVRG